MNESRLLPAMNLIFSKKLILDCEKDKNKKSESFSVVSKLGKNLQTKNH